MFGTEIKIMRYIVYIFLFFSLFSCSASKEYMLYRRDRSINYPKEKLSLRLINDTIGLFVNSDEGREPLNQKFSFKRADKFLVIESVNPSDQNLISLNQGDTIIVHKNRLHFFYEGSKRYLLSFKKKI